LAALWVKQNAQLSLGKKDRTLVSEGQQNDL